MFVVCVPLIRVYLKLIFHLAVDSFNLKDPSQARLCYCFDLKFAIKLLVERDKTSQQFNW